VSSVYKRVKPFMSQDLWSRLMTWKYNVPFKQDLLIAKLTSKSSIKKNKLIFFNLNNKNAENKIKKMICKSKKFIVKFFLLLKELNPNELESLVKSKHFTDFFNRSSKFLEKVLDHGDGDMLEMILKDGFKAK